MSVYMVQPAISFGTTNYKIGMSTSSTMKRLKSYGSNCTIIIARACTNPIDMERELKRSFNGCGRRGQFGRGGEFGRRRLGSHRNKWAFSVLKMLVHALLTVFMTVSLKNDMNELKSTLVLSRWRCI